MDSLNDRLEILRPYPDGCPKCGTEDGFDESMPHYHPRTKFGPDGLYWYCRTCGFTAITDIVKFVDGP